VVAYSFRQQFRPPILAGTKRQTIRADRKRHARPGEQLQLYTGMRTRQQAARRSRKPPEGRIMQRTGTPALQGGEHVSKDCPLFAGVAAE
jgi:hypothetical protein